MAAAITDSGAAVNSSSTENSNGPWYMRDRKSMRGSLRLVMFKVHRVKIIYVVCSSDSRMTPTS